ncbi:MAG: c-type cytochrome [Acidobacteriota bacterium]|nr:MAG: c-type cytochrome [Acidobacteriota bacterium]
MSLRSNKLIVCTALIVSLSIASGFYRTTAAEQKDRKEAQKLKNPVPSNAETIEAGRQLYQRHCASCHGPKGKGDGGMALSGGTPSDLTDDVWDYGSTDGEIFVVIRDGVSSDMLGYKEKLKDEQIWRIVNFIRDLGPKKEKVTHLKRSRSFGRISSRALPSPWSK